MLAISKTKIGCSVVLGLIIFLVASLIIVNMGRPPHNDRILTLARDPHINLIKFVITNQQRMVLCTDPSTLKYFEEYLQQPAKESNSGGTSYNLTMQFSNNEKVVHWITVHKIDDGFDFFREISWSGEGVEEFIPFKQPIPENLQQILLFLQKPISAVQNQTMVVTEQGIEIK